VHTFATPVTEQTIWRPPLRRLTVGLVMLVVATAFEALAVATSMPATVRELGHLDLYGWAFSAFLLTNLVGITVGGGESDRIGPARVISAGTLLFASGLVVSGFAPSMAVIVAGRALQGFGGGLLFSAAYAAIARAYRVEIQPRVLAVLSSDPGLGRSRCRRARDRARELALGVLGTRTHADPRDLARAAGPAHAAGRS